MKYACVNRPPGYASVPDGWEFVGPKVDGCPWRRFGTISYDPPLSADIARTAQLVPLAETIDEAVEAVVGQLHYIDNYREEAAEDCSMYRWFAAGIGSVAELLEAKGEVGIAPFTALQVAEKILGYQMGSK